MNDFFNKCDQETADLVTFTEEIIDGKLQFLCSESASSYLALCYLKIIKRKMFLC